MKGQRTRGPGGPRSDIHPPDWQTHKHAENFFDKKRERSRLAAKNKRALAFDSYLISPPRPKTLATAEGGTKEGHFYRSLPKEFRRNGFIYRQIAREGNAAIYEQRWTGCAEPSVCYEVIRVRYHDGFHISGRFVEPAEVYPNSEAWGVDGWTVTTLDAGYEKLRALRSGQ